MKHVSYLNRNLAVMFLVFALLTAGCSKGIVHRPLDIALSKHIYNATALSRIPQEEISIFMQEKKYTSEGGGLLWIMIDSGINKARASSAEKTIAPLRKAAADVDFRTQFWNELEKELSSSSWLKILRLDKRSFGYTKEEIVEMKPPFILFTTFYQLSPNSQVLVVQTKVQASLKDVNTPPDYYGFCTYYSKKIGQHHEEAEKAIELWSADHASAYRKALSEGIEQNMKMLRTDFIDSPANPIDEKGEELLLSVRSPISGSVEKLQGKVLSREGSRIVMREKGGNLFSVDTTSSEQ